MQMDCGMVLRPRPVHRQVQECLFGRAGSGQVFAGVGDHGQIVSSEFTQGGVGGGDQHSASHTQAEVSGCSPGQSPLVQGPGQSDEFAAAVHVGHRLWSHASRKSPGIPRFPDLSRMDSPGSVSVFSHGTPGETSLPTWAEVMPSLRTTAPEVSPPATISCRQPRPTSPSAIVERLSSVTSAARA
jgi:hypothetical protein